MKIPPEHSEICSRINEALCSYADKDWNYSRIRLQTRTLDQITSPYALWVEYAGTQADLKALKAEIIWGGRHGDELGILEIVSLRLNKALLDSTSDDFWDQRRPLIRLIKKQELELQGVESAFWYEVEEVGGEDFDSR